MNIINQVCDRIIKFGSVEIIDVENASLFDMNIKNNDLVSNDNKYSPEYILAYTLVHSLLKERDLCIANDDKFKVDDDIKLNVIKKIYNILVTYMTCLDENTILEMLIIKDKDDFVNRLSKVTIKDYCKLNDFNSINEDLGDKYYCIETLMKELQDVLSSLSDTYKSIKK